MTAIDPFTEHDCLADEQNLEVRPGDRDDIVVRVCLVCGRRHFEVEVDPAEIGIVMNGRT